MDRHDEDDGEEQGERTYCQHTYLCLGTSVIDGIKIAGVLRSRTRKVSGDCRHLVDYDEMPHTNATSKVVARLWGWKEDLNTLPTAVARSGWSSPVWFVAVSGWDRIMIWSVAVAELGEDFEGEDVGHDDESNGDDADSTPATAKGERRQKEEATEDIKGYYEKVWDAKLEASVVKLKPVVLNMGNGGVVKKMVWSRHTDGNESEDEADEVADDEEDTPPDWRVSSRFPNAQAGHEEPEASTGPDDVETSLGDITGELNATVEEGATRGPNAAESGSSSTSRTAKRRKGRNPPGLRLKVLTDRGVSMWELGVWARGKLKKNWLDETVVRLFHGHCIEWVFGLESVLIA